MTITTTYKEYDGDLSKIAFTNDALIFMGPSRYINPGADFSLVDDADGNGTKAAANGYQLAVAPVLMKDTVYVGTTTESGTTKAPTVAYYEKLSENAGFTQLSVTVSYYNTQGKRYTQPLHALPL